MTLSQTRLHILAVLMLLALLMLTGRLWMLQLTRWVVYARAAAGNATSVAYSPAPRGMIFDRNGIVLAENRPVWNVAVVASRFPKSEVAVEKIVGRLASLLQVPAPQVREALKTASRQRGEEAVPLEDVGQDVTLKTVAQIEEQALDLPGIVIAQSAVRSYRHKTLAAHVLGYARPINDLQYKRIAELNYPLLGVPRRMDDLFGVEGDPIYSRDSIYGQSGVEKQYEIDLNVAPPLPVLSGRRGRSVYEVDAELNRVRVIDQRLPAVGAAVYLTIDARVQQAAEETLAAVLAKDSRRTGAAVALDVQTGAVLALASLPSFDPNEWVKKISPQKWQAISRDPRTPLLNKALLGGYPPASTFKMISTVAALETGKGNPNKRYVCTGSIHEGPQKFECWKHDGHGGVDFRQALARSCDVYFYELVRSGGLTPDDIAKYARLFGLGEKTGIDMPDELTGLVPSPAWKMDRYHERWWSGDSLNMVIGQGATTASPMQMALACAAVANGGNLLVPHVVSKIVWPKHLGLTDTTYGQRVRRRLDVKPETLQLVREGMREAVIGEGGTGKAMQGLGINVAGKTGSAEHIPGRPTHAWFVCFAPYEAPKYAIAVFVSEGGHGGSSAAPVARSILAALYGFKRSALSEESTGPSD